MSGGVSGASQNVRYPRSDRRPQTKQTNIAKDARCANLGSDVAGYINQVGALLLRIEDTEPWSPGIYRGLPMSNFREDRQQVTIAI